MTVNKKLYSQKIFHTEPIFGIFCCFLFKLVYFAEVDIFFPKLVNKFLKNKQKVGLFHDPLGVIHGRFCIRGHLGGLYTQEGYTRGGFYTGVYSTPILLQSLIVYLISVAVSRALSRVHRRLCSLLIGWVKQFQPISSLL